MATNDNRAMVEAARACYIKKYGNPAEGIDTFRMNNTVDIMVDFAALAVAAERTRIAAELSIAYPGKGHDGTWLINFIDKLRAERDADR